MASAPDKGTQVDAVLLVEQLAKQARLSHSTNGKERQEAVRELLKLGPVVLNNPAVVDAGGVDALIDLCKSNEPAVQFEAVKLLANFALQERYKDHVGSRASVETLVVLAMKGNVLIKRQVARAFAALAAHPGMPGALVQLGVLRPLVALLRFDNEEVQRQATKAAGLLAEEGTNAVKMLASGVVQELSVLAAASANAQIHADLAKALGNIARHESIQSALVDQGVVNLLLRLMLAEHHEVTSEAVRGLYHLLLAAQGTPLIAEPAAISKIVQMSCSTDPEVQLHGLGALAGLSTNASFRRPLLDQNIGEFLRGLAKSGHYNLHLLASCALVHLALEDDGLAAMSQEATSVIMRTAAKQDLTDDVRREAGRVVGSVDTVAAVSSRLRGDKAVAELLSKRARGFSVHGDGGENASAEDELRDANGWTVMHEAACLGNVDAVSKMLAKNVSHRDVDVDKQTPLHTAAAWGHVEVVRMLVLNGADLNAVDVRGQTPLHLAVISNNEEVIRLLLEFEAEPNVPDEMGNPPLHHAAQCGHENLIELLLAAGCAPFKRNEEHKTAYVMAMDHNNFRCADILCNLHAAVRNGNFESLEYLIRTMGRDVNQMDEKKNTALHEACRLGNLNMAKFLIERGAKLDVANVEGETPFLLSCRGGNKDLVDYLIKALKRVGLPFEANAAANNGRTGMHEAAAHGHVAVSTFLLKKGGDLQAKDVDGNSPLHLACEKNQAITAGSLIDRGADEAAVNNAGQTPADVATDEVLRYLKNRKLNASDLTIAVRTGDIEAVKVILDNAAKPIDLNQPDGDSTFLIEAIKGGHAELVDLLLERGADANLADTTGDANTPLHHAAIVDSEGIVRSLLRAGAIKKRNQNGAMPHELANSKNRIVLNLLRPIHDAVRLNNARLAELLIRAGENLDYADEHGDSALHVAAQVDNIRLANKLAVRGADVDVRDPLGDTPAVRACKISNVKAMCSFFENGADANVADNNGRAGLHHAVDKGKLDECASLIEYGGNKRQEDNDGVTPLQMAEQSPQRDAFLALFNDLRLACGGGILTDIVELVEAGKDVNGKDAEGRTPLHFAARRDQVDVVEYLLAEGGEIDAADNKGNTPLMAACGNGSSEAAAVLIENEATIAGPINEDGETPFLLGCRGGLATELLEVMTEDGVQVTEVDKKANNALHHAAMGGQIDVLEWLLDQEEVPYVQNAEDKTPYDLAVEFGHTEAAVMLSTLHRAVASDDLDVVDLHIKNGADVNKKNEDGEVPLHTAARLGHVEAAVMLIESGAAITPTDNDQGTPLHLASGQGHVKMLTTFFEKLAEDIGSAINARDRAGRTPLHRAAAGGHSEACQILLNFGADASLKDNDGNTAFVVALQNGHTSTMMVLQGSGADDLEAMLASGIDVNALTADGSTILHSAVKTGNKDLAAALLKHGASANIKDLGQGNTAVHQCVIAGNADILAMLLDADGSPAAKNLAGDTPIHLAVRAGRDDLLDLLLAKDAEAANVQNNVGDTPLHEAVRLGNMDMARKLIEQGADSSLTNGEGKTAFQLAVEAGFGEEFAKLVGNLHAAVISGNLFEVELLLKSGVDVNAKDENGWTPLHHAAYLGLADIAKALIAAGADLNALDSQGRTPLHLACQAGSVECAEVLIAAGADLNSQDPNQRTPLHLACNAGDMELAKFLLDSGADPTLMDASGCTCFHHAVMNGNTDVMKLLLGHGVAGDMQTKDGLTPLQIAVMQGNRDAVAMLVDITPYVAAGDLEQLKYWLSVGADVNRKDANGWTAAHEACRQGNDEMLQILIEHGANLNVKDHEGNSPLHVACVNGHKACADLCIKHKADVNCQDNKYRAPLHLASFTNNLPIVESLLTAKANVDAQDTGGWSPLHLAAFADNCPLVSALVAAKANKHLLNAEGHTPCMLSLGKQCAAILLDLVEAVKANDLPEVRRLLDAGANVNARDDSGWTALHHAVHLDLDKMAELLMEAGVEKDAGDRHGATAVHIGGAVGSVAAGEAVVVAKAQINAKDAQGRTPLMVASLAGQEEYVKMLLRHGAEVNEQDRAGNTALHYAVLKGHKGIVEALLRAGARTDLMNNDGQTPYMVGHAAGQFECAAMVSDLVSAVQAGNLPEVSRLLDAGANPNAVNVNGSSALHEACRGGFTDIARLLLEKGAIVDCMDKDEATPLHLSVHNGHMECAELLFERGADPNARLVDGGTILHSAAAGGDIKCAEMCLKKGIPINVVDNKMRTPLHLAALMGHTEMVKYLLANGADMDAQDEEGYAALHYALRAGPQGADVMAVLMKHFEDSRTEAERQAELEFAARSADFDAESPFQVGADEMDVILSKVQLSRLIRFAYSDDVEEQHQAARSLTNLSVNVVNQPRIVAAGGLILLNKLANSPYAAVQFQSLRALANLASHEDNKLPMCEGEILQTLMDVGSEGNVAVKRQVARAMANMASHESTKVKMVEKGVAGPLISCSYCHIVEVQRQASRAFASLSRDPDNQMPLVESGVLEALVHLASLGHEKIDPNVSWTIANLCESVYNHNPVVEIGAIELLVRFASTGDDVTKMHGTRAMHYLATRQEVHLFLIQAKAVEACVAALSHAEHEIRLHAAGTLVGLACNPIYRDTIVAANAVDMLANNARMHQYETLKLMSAAACLFLANVDKRQQRERKKEREEEQLEAEKKDPSLKAQREKEEAEEAARLAAMTPQQKQQKAEEEERELKRERDLSSTGKLAVAALEQLQDAENYDVAVIADKMLVNADASDVISMAIL